MKLALYRGTSLVSRLIRWQTRSVYSHAAMLMDDDTVYEAWHRGGVSHAPTLGFNHSPGTMVELYTFFATDDQLAKIEAFLKSQVGCKYDWLSVIRFVTRFRTTDGSKSRWFCSELVFAALDAAGIPPLSRIEPHLITPRDLGMSPVFEFERTTTT